MPIELTYENLDAVPEAFRELYVEQDGKAMLTGVTGMKTQKDVDTLNGALTKERSDHKTAATSLKLWGDLKPDEVRVQLDRIPELETAAEGNMDDEKINGIVEGRIKSKTAPLERDLNTANETIATLTGERDVATGELDKFKKSTVIRQGAVEAKVHTSALEDIEQIAAGMTEFNENGNLVSKDGFGITPGLDMKNFFKEMQEKRQHWWPESEGGGSKGGKGLVGSSGKNPFSDKDWNLTEQGRVITADGRDMADRLAKAAGTTVGGLRPKPKT